MLGKEFGDYRIIRKIGEGNMGQVYLGLQKSLEREIAIKIMAFSPDFSNNNAERFLREAKIAASIQHPNIVNVYAVGQEESFHYIAMEYVSGGSLDNSCYQKLPEIETWQVALQLSHALQTALESNVIHRDIKPSNVMVTAKGTVKLADFGLSKRLDDNAEMTQQGMILGTPKYMSPEQSSGQTLDFRSDVYSLGATLYRILTQEFLFSADSIIDVLCLHRTESPIDPLVHNTELSAEGSYILAKMLHKTKEDRYQSYRDLIIDIQCLLNRSVLQFASEKDAAKLYKNRTQSGGIKKTTQKFMTTFKNMITGAKRETPSQTPSQMAQISSQASQISQASQQYSGTQSGEKTIDIGDEATKMIPQSQIYEAHQQYLRTVELIKEGNYSFALRILKIQTKEYSFHVPSLLLLAMIANEQGERELAYESSRKAMFIAPKEPYVIFIMADVCENQGRLKDATVRYFWALDILEKMPEEVILQYSENLSVKQLKNIIQSRMKTCSHTK